MCCGCHDLVRARVVRHFAPVCNRKWPRKRFARNSSMNTSEYLSHMSIDALLKRTSKCIAATLKWFVGKFINCSHGLRWLRQQLLRYRQQWPRASQSLASSSDAQAQAEVKSRAAIHFGSATSSICSPLKSSVSTRSDNLIKLSLRLLVSRG